jgi:hypothetical protein
MAPRNGKPWRSFLGYQMIASPISEIIENKSNLDSMIMAVTATPTYPATAVSSLIIRLKYLAVAGGCGPEITLDRGLALRTIAALQAALEGKAYDSERDYHE